MASSSDAFLRLDRWKNFKTPLKLTVLTKGGMPEVFRCVVTATDEECFVFSFIPNGTRDLKKIDLRGARFSLGKRSMIAEKSEEDVLKWEEI
jgi:hypothetical protein